MLFWSGTQLALEVAKVVEARFQLIAQGECTVDEVFLMMWEKLGAFNQATSIAARGGHPELIVQTYRNIVTANIARLSK